jgi:ABC-2 type transport system permease protein
MFRKTLSFVRMGAQNLLAYKFEISLFTIISFLSLSIYYFLWHTIYSYSNTTLVSGFTFSQLMGYYILTNFAGAYFWSDMDSRISDRIRDGKLIVDLARPATLLRTFVATEMGQTLFVLAVQTAPIIIMGVLLFNLRAGSLLSLVLSIISFSIAIVLSMIFVFFVGLSSFWLTRYHGVRYARSALTWILCGGVFPLAFLPQFWQKILIILPFQHFVYTPIQIFLGGYTSITALEMIGLQIMWLVIFYGLVKLAWPRAMAKFSEAGG